MADTEFLSRINLYLKAGQVEAAERTIHGSIIDQPKSVELLSQLANIKHLQGKFSEAVDLWREVLAIDKINHDAVHCLVITLCDVGAYSEAREVYNTYLETVDKQPETSFLERRVAENYLTNAQLYLNCGNHHQSALEVQRALNINSRSDFAHLILGKVYAAQDKWQEAQREFELALKYNDHSAEVCSWLGLACYQNRRLQMAKSYWEKALDIEPGLLIAEAYLLFLKDQN